MRALHFQLARGLRFAQSRSGARLRRGGAPQSPQVVAPAHARARVRAPGARRARRPARSSARGRAVPVPVSAAWSRAAVEPSCASVVPACICGTGAGAAAAVGAPEEARGAARPVVGAGDAGELGLRERRRVPQKVGRGRRVVQERRGEERREEDEEEDEEERQVERVQQDLRGQASEGAGEGERERGSEGLVFEAGRSAEDEKGGVSTQDFQKMISCTAASSTVLTVCDHSGARRWTLSSYDCSALWAMCSAVARSTLQEETVTSTAICSWLRMSVGVCLCLSVLSAVCWTDEQAVLLDLQADSFVHSQSGLK